MPEQLSGLSPLLESQRHPEGPMIPDAFATLDTSLRNLGKISGGTDIPEGSVTSEWLDQHVELGVRDATKTLLDNGLMTVSSSANHENVGENRTSRPYIAISMERSKPESKALFLSRVEELQDAAKQRELSLDDTGFHIFEDMNPRNAGQEQVVIMVDASDTDTVGDVSNRFSELVNFLTAKAEAETTFETNLSDKQQKIFAPFIKEKTVVVETSDSEYYKMLDPNSDLSHKTVESAKREGSSEETRTVTEQSLQDAEKSLSSITDFTIKADIADRAKVLGVNPTDKEALVNMIRTDAQTRYTLASGLLRKLEGLVGSDQLPERIGRATETKSPRRSYGGFSHIPSSDYAVALALSMIDGTFESSASDAEQQRVPLKNKTNGQHRAIARALIFDQYS